MKAAALVFSIHDLYVYICARFGWKKMKAEGVGRFYTFFFLGEFLIHFFGI